MSATNAGPRRLRRVSFLLGLLLATPWVRANDAPPKAGAAAAEEVALAIAMDPGEASGVATASVRIHATREALWNILTSCAQALQIVPGLKFCVVEETATDQSWQRIRQVMD